MSFTKETQGRIDESGWDGTDETDPSLPIPYFVTPAIDLLATNAAANGWAPIVDPLTGVAVDHLAWSPNVGVVLP